MLLSVRFRAILFQVLGMKRREFIGLAASTAAGWPLRSLAERPGVPVIGFLGSTASEEYQQPLAAFRAALGADGYVEGSTVTIDYRWAQGRYEQLGEMAADLVRRPVAVIATVGGLISARAAATATRSLPIVFVVGGDPVRLGLVDSLGHPGRNVTGVALISNALVAKRMELLRELLPNAVAVTLLVNPGNPSQEFDIDDSRAAAQALGVRLEISRAKTAEEIDHAVAAVAETGAAALIVEADGFFISQRQRFVGLAARYKLPAIFEFREFVNAGGLVSYGASRNEAARQAGSYVARILKGAKPTDLPVQQPTKFELVINLKTAKALGLTIPLALLARADEIIE